MLRQLTSAPAKAARLSARVATPLSTSAAALAPFRRSGAAAVATAAVRSRPAPATFARWYSSEPAKEEPAAAAGEAAEGKEAAAEAAEPLSAADAAALRKELETKTKEAADFKDKYLRSVADFRNLQERTQRDMKNARDYAITHFAKDLVDSVDNLDRALAMVPNTAEAAAEAVKDTSVEDLSKDVANLVDGLRMTETVLLQTLKKHGLERFDPLGDKFNPNEHEATFMTPVQDKENNTVFHTQQTGFKLNGRILRAAKVGVVKNK